MVPVSSVVMRSHEAGMKDMNVFELLPVEVCERIALYVSGAETTIDALHLAETSERMKGAVLAAVSYKLCTWSTSIPSTYLSRWTKAFEGQVRDLEIPEVTRITRSLLHSASLVDLQDLPAQHDILPLLKGLPNLRSLQLRITSSNADQPSAQYIRDTLFELTNLKALELVIRCTCKLGNIACELDQLEFSDGVRHQLPTVTALHLAAECKRSCAVWPIHETFPSLREITVERNTPDSQIPYLQCLESVKIESGEYSCRPDREPLATSIGRPVTSYHEILNKLSKKQVEDLCACPRLTHLHVKLREAAEAGLPKIAKNLKTLDISWASYERYESAYYAPPFGALARIVKAAPLLEQLHLGEAKVSKDEMTHVLRMCGSRLRSLGTYIMYQDESPAERFAGLMETIAVHNRGLRHFVIGDAPQRERQKREDVERLRLALRRLYRHLPLLRAPWLEWNVEGFAQLV